MLNIQNVKVRNLNITAPVPPPNYALYFNTNESVVITGYTGIGGTNARTIAAWIKTPSPGPVAWRTIVSWGDLSAFYRLMDFVIVEDGRFAVHTYGAILLSTTYVGVDEWTHVAWSFSGSGNGTMFMNGSPVATTLSLGTLNTYLTQNVSIGKRSDNQQYFDGDMDEVAIWSKALSNNDIADIYNGGSGLCINPSSTFPTDGGSMGTNLEGLWHFNDGSGINATDSSGNNRTGTLTNMDNSNWVAGKVQC